MLNVTVNENVIAAALLDAGWLDEIEVLDRDRIAAAVGDIVAEWCKHWSCRNG